MTANDRSAGTVSHAGRVKIAIAPPSIPTCQFQRPKRQAVVPFGGADRRQTRALGHRRRLQFMQWELAPRTASSKAALAIYGATSLMVSFMLLFQTTPACARAARPASVIFSSRPSSVPVAWLPPYPPKSMSPVTTYPCPITAWLDGDTTG